MNNSQIQVLLLDDDDNLRMTLAGIVEVKGMRPVSCATVNEALAAVTAQEIDVALVDLRLGANSGLHFLQALRRQNSDTECIVLTGYASQQAAIDAVNEGAYSFVQKPFDMEHLLLTIRRAAEKRASNRLLRRNEERYRHISELFSDYAYSYLIAPDGKIELEWLVGGFEQITGRKITDAEWSEARNEAIHPDDHPHMQKGLERLLANRTDTSTYRVVRPDGAVRWLEEFTRLDHASDAGWVRVLGAARDITERKDAELEREALQKLVASQERLATIGQLSAGIAHDFDNILGVITLQAQMISLTQDLNQRNNERVALIQQQIQHASHLIQQILDFGRQSVLERQSLDLRATLAQQISLLQRTLPEDIDIRLDAGKDDYTILADPTRIQQIVMNLAVNARDAMPNGGTLTFTLFRTHSLAGDSAVNPITGEEWIALEVRDSGTGIAPDVLNRIFEPFFTTKRARKGTGLGLAQVQGIVGQHGGHIQVSSTEGQGTTFTVYLPAQERQVQASPPRQETAIALGDAQTVLVVEDDEILREALQETIEMFGYRTVPAANGLEALEVLAAPDQRPDLILSDLVMPQMGGVALLNALDERQSTTPVVILTGHPLDNDPEIFGMPFVRATLMKPVSPDLLADTLAAALKTTRAPIRE